VSASSVPLADTVGLLERAIGYAICTARRLSPQLMTSPTPCRDWNLGTLLRHLNDSLAVLHEGFDTHRIGSGTGADSDADPVTTFHDRAWRLFGTATAAAGRTEPITLLDRPLATSAVAAVGAVEIAVHAWDISQACHHTHPIPGDLAGALLDIAPPLLTGCRRRLFDPPVAVSPLAPASDRLVAFLGRHP